MTDELRGALEISTTDGRRRLPDLIQQVYGGEVPAVVFHRYGRSLAALVPLSALSAPVGEGKAISVVAHTWGDGYRVIGDANSIFAVQAALSQPSPDGGWKALGAALVATPGATGRYSWPPVGGGAAHDPEYLSLHTNDLHLPSVWRSVLAALPPLASGEAKPSETQSEKR